jgi:hypothetical protein
MRKYAAGLPNGSYRVPGPESRFADFTRSKLFSNHTGSCSSPGYMDGNGRARARKSLEAEHGPEPCNSQYVLAQVNA